MRELLLFRIERLIQQSNVDFSKLIVDGNSVVNHVKNHADSLQDGQLVDLYEVVHNAVKLKEANAQIEQTSQEILRLKTMSGAYRHELEELYVERDEMLLRLKNAELKIESRAKKPRIKDKTLTLIEI